MKNEILVRSARQAFAAAVLLILASCGPSKPQQNAASADVVWDTLPSGAVHAVYSSFPVLPLTTTAVKRIGGVGAQGPAAFADVRALDVDRSGTLLVLDGQTELRAFDTTGAYVRTVMKSGQGPGEIAQANGFRVDTLGAIWVNDHARWQVTRLHDGDFTTYPMAAQQFSFLWEGGVTHDGRVWDAVRQMDEAMGPGGKPGPQELKDRLYFKGFDPATGAMDSVALGVETRQTGVYAMMFVAVPFTADPLSALDPAGAVWTAQSDTYRLVKHSLKGDTLLIVEMPGIGPDVSAQERAAAIAKVTDAIAAHGGPAGRSAAQATDWEAVVPKRKPILVNLSVDDQSRLWVQRRTLSRGPVFDIFSPTGQLLGSLDPDFEPASYLPPVVRGKSFYAVLTDSLDVPTVIRAPVPLR